MSSSIVAFIIAASALSVNAETLPRQIRKAVEQGELSSFTTDIADHIGIERSLPYRALEVQQGNAFHDFTVILQNEEPLCLVLMVSSDSATQSNGYGYRTNLHGDLERAFFQTGRFDAEHKPIRGSGVITDLKLTPEVRKGFRHEMDFWLKGMYRKPAKTASTAAHATPDR